MSKKIKMYVGIPSTGFIVDSQTYLLRDLEKDYGDTIEFVYPQKLTQRIFHDAARNGIVEEFLATDCDVLWFLDSDITPPRHVLDLIAVHWDKWKVAGAPYPVFMGQLNEEHRQIVFTAYKGTNGVGIAPAKIPYEGIEFVDGLATGCMFIKREIFSLLQKPYFEFKFNPETRVLTEGEDLGFCLKLNKLGIQFFTDYSMVCKHRKELDLLEMNNYAIDYANKAVNAYDQMVRGQVAALQARYNDLLSRYKAKMTPTFDQEHPKSKLILPPGLR